MADTKNDLAAMPVWVERTGDLRYVGRNPRGAEVQIGSNAVPGVHFTPGELLKVALAACSAVTAEPALVRRLGDDVEVTVRTQGVKDTAEDRYPELAEELVVDLSGLDEAERERLVTVVRRAVDRHCTVGRTVEAGAQVELTLTTEP